MSDKNGPRGTYKTPLGVYLVEEWTRGEGFTIGLVGAYNPVKGSGGDEWYRTDEPYVKRGESMVVAIIGTDPENEELVALALQEDSKVDPDVMMFADDSVEFWCFFIRPGKRWRLEKAIRKIFD